MKALRKNSFYSEQGFFLFIILVFCFFSYIQTINFEFLQWDDDAEITKNAYVKNLNWQSISHNIDRERFTFITLTFYSLLYKIWGNNPEPFHWVSLVVHLLNVVLVFYLIKCFTKNIFTISLVVLLFALHPMRVESVAWISELKDLLFTFFSLAAILFYIKYQKKDFKIHYFILSSLMLILASFSKVQGLLVPAVFIMIDIVLKRKFTLELIAEKIILLRILFDIFIFLSIEMTAIIIAFLLVLIIIKKKQIIENFFSGVFYFRRNALINLAKIIFFIVITCLTIFIFIRLEVMIFGILIPLLIPYLLFEKALQNRNLSRFIKHIRFGLIGLVSLAGFILLFYYLPQYSEGFWIGYSESRNAFSFFERILLAGYALWFYFSKFFAPVSLNAVHPYPFRLENGQLPPEYFYTLIVLFFVIALSVYMIIKRKKIHNIILFGWFFFLVNISIVLHIIPIQGRLVVADRYSYFAYLGLFISAGFLGEKYLFQNKKLKKVLIFCFAILLVGLSLLTYNRSKVWGDTKTLFTDVLNKNPLIPFAYCNLAAAYMSENLPDTAIACFNKAIAMDSTDSYAFFNRAFSFLDNKNDKKALEDFLTTSKVTTNNKLKALCFANIGDIYYNRRDDSLSIFYFNMAIKTDSTVAMPYNKRGVYYLNKNEISRAQSDFLKAIELDVFYAEAYNNIGTVYMTKGDVNNARKNFTRAIELERDYVIAYYNRGFLKYNNGDASGAIKDYNLAIKYNPDLMKTYIQRGRAYAYLRDYKSAVKDFSLVLKNDSSEMLALTNRAYAYYYDNAVKDAEKDFISVSRYHPESPVSWQNLAWFYMQQKDFNMAVSCYKKSLSIDSSQIVSYINLGWLYMEQSDYNNAGKYFMQALQVSPNNTEAIFMLGELNRKKGNNTTACDYFKKASDMGYPQAQAAWNKYCNN
ncbi:MAG: DUF2225 domain-containing protein [Bacteroidales bacterium]|nr:DUF2225 domain-containing protein [Bacteroidales bacterium]